MSLCIKVNILDNNANTIHNLLILENLFLKENRLIIRAAPYLPNFRSIPARTIDPLVLASTCAFGSQKWNPNIGILIKKGIKQIIIVPGKTQERVWILLSTKSIIKIIIK